MLNQRPCQRPLDRPAAAVCLTAALLGCRTLQTNQQRQDAELQRLNAAYADAVDYSHALTAQRRWVDQEHWPQWEQAVRDNDARLRMLESDIAQLAEPPAAVNEPTRADRLPPIP